MQFGGGGHSSLQRKDEVPQYGIIRTAFVDHETCIVADAQMSEELF
jgi:hypothetical protein